MFCGGSIYYSFNQSLSNYWDRLCNKFSMLHVVELSIENKMNDAKKLYDSLSIVGSIAAAVSLPWIILKMCRSIYLQSSFSNLKDKVVVITGASSGLGEALAHEFYRKGCLVVLCARRKEELNRVRTDLLHSHCYINTHSPIVMPLDLSEINSIPEIIKEITSITGHIDILINNGGVSHRGPIIATNIDVDMNIMKVNYFGNVAITKAVLQDMIKRKQGQIVFISSVQGLIALPERSAYGASKHALQAFSDSLRAEVRNFNIFVTTVSPGYIKTNLSLNALTGTGDSYGKMDEATENGYTPVYVAEKILHAVVAKSKEEIIAPVIPKVAIFIRKYLPSLYFLIMARRFEKKHS